MEAEAETESPPNPVVVTGDDENPASTGGGVAEAEEGGGGGGDSSEAKVTVGRKRGRPRKQQVEESAAATIPSAQKRGRGRPRGSGKIQSLASSGGFAVDTAGGHFTPHAVTIQIGEDIVEKILSFSQRGPQAICVLSAIGPISIVDICPNGSFDGILRYEGHFELLTLSGSHIFREMGGARRKIGMLNVSLANNDGRVFGGDVAGSLIAAGPVQLILASFKQSIRSELLRWHSAESSTAAGIPNAPDTVRGVLPTQIGKMTNIEENCMIPSPFPEPQPNDAGNIISDPNVNHASHQSFDQNDSQPSGHVSDQSVADINDGVLEM